MSDRDDSTGQFTAPEPQTFGRESVEQAAGYVPFVDDNADDGELTLEEAREQLASTAEADVKTYTPFSDLDANITLTEKQAAKALEDGAKADEAQAELEQNEAVRKAVDEQRGEDAKADEPADPQVEVEKALELPHVKEAIDKITSEAQTARAQYQAGLNEAATIAQAAFITQFPELANAPPEQHAEIARQLQESDPARFAQLESMALNAAAIFQAGHAEMQRVAQEKQAKLQEYAKAEGARFEQMVSDTPQERKEITDGIVEAIKEYGGDPTEIFTLLQRSEFSNATVQRLLYDVGKLRRIEKAPKAIAAKELPRVQRPGSPAPRGSASLETLATLQKQLDSAKTEGQQLRIGRKIIELQSQTRRAS